MKNKPSYARTIHLWVFSFLVSLAAVSLAGFTIDTTKATKQRIETVRTQYIEEQRRLVKSEVENFTTVFEDEMDRLLLERKLQVKLRVAAAHSVAQSIFNKRAENHTRKEIENLIIDALKPISLDQGGGYYFILDLDGTIKLIEDRPELEETVALELKDSRGIYLFKEMIETVQSKGEGFQKYHWSKPNQQGNDFEKIAFVKYFKPLNWFIGAGVYIEDVENELHATITKYAENLRYGPNQSGYNFVYELLNIEGGENFAKVYVNPNMPTEIGEMISDDFEDSKGNKFRQEFLKGVRQHGECYVDYWYKKIGDPAFYPKTGFFKLAAKGRYIVGGGFYMDDVESQIVLLQASLKKQLKQGYIKICSIFVIAILFALLAANIFKKKLENDFTTFIDFFKVPDNSSSFLDRNSVNFFEFDRLAQFINCTLSQKLIIENDLKETQTRLSEAQEIAKIGHYIYDIKNDNWTNSHVLDHICGINCSFKKDLAGWMQIVHEEDRSKMFEFLQKEVLLKQNIFDLEYKITNQISGEEKWVHGLGSLKLDETGQPIEMFGTIQDITERKRAEEALLLTQFAFDKAAMGIFRIGNDGRILNVNERVCEKLDFTEAELRSMTIFDLDPSLDPTSWSEMWQHLCEAKIINSESEHRRKDGTLFPIEITANLLDFGGEKFSIVFVRDITEKRSSEQQQAKLESHLQQVTRLDSLGTLAGGIAHDFNNILSAIMGYTDLIKFNSLDNQKVQHFIEQLGTASLRAKNLVQQILSFSRQSNLEKQPIDISKAVNEALNLIRATIPTTIEISKQIPPNLGIVVANETQIHQIVMNICTNAYHAMDQEGGSIDAILSTTTITAKDGMNFPDLDPGEYLKLIITDTGSGIPEEIAAKIFDPYFTTKNPEKGTGLGLSTVHGIVKDHGGCIKVYSELNVGTSFQIFLPIVDLKAQKIDVLDEQLPCGSETILFIDDEKLLLEIGKELLETIGYKVETRASSIDALEAFRVRPAKYDLIISDMTMPKMTGDQLAIEIKKIEPKVPIILYTGFSTRINSEKLKKIGIAKVLMKPVTIKELAVNVRHALDHI